MAADQFFQFSLEDPKVIIGLFIGGLLPFIFTAFSMDAVGKAAGAVVREVRRQLQAKPGILTGQDKPDYGTCVDIVTKAALARNDRAGACCRWYLWSRSPLSHSWGRSSSVVCWSGRS